jgi:hypothetical protein
MLVSKFNGVVVLKWVLLGLVWGGFQGSRRVGHRHGNSDKDYLKINI